MRHIILKPAIIGGLLLSLTACNAVTGEAKRTIEYMFEKTPDYVMSAEQISEFPYTALYVNQDGSPQSLVVLGYVDGTLQAQNFSWISAERETVVTRNGRVIRTEGLHANLTGLSSIEHDPLRCVVTARSDCNLQWSRYHDFELRNGTRISRHVESRFEISGEESLLLPSGETTVTLVREHVDVAVDKQHYVNEFWIEADGHVVKSRQGVLHNEPHFTLTQVKWVGR